MIGGALAAPAILPSKLFGRENSDTLKVGLIGCGGRGSGAANQALTTYTQGPLKLVAMADVFKDRLDGSLKELKKQHEDRIESFRA